MNTDLSDNKFYSLLGEHCLSQMECEEMEKTKEEKERQEARMNTLEGKKNEVRCSEKKQRQKFQSNTHLLVNALLRVFILNLLHVLWCSGKPY